MYAIGKKDIQVPTSGKENGRVGSVHRFALFQVPLEKGGLAEKVGSGNSKSFSNVAELMESIKNEVKQNRNNEAKGSSSVSSEIKSQVTVSKEDKLKDKDTYAVNKEDKDVDINFDDSFDEFDGLDQNARRKSLVVVCSLRPQRLATVKAVEVVQVVKARSKKSQRQAKKATASKK
ncbi:hypothetical protein PTKIN_Ptkin11bG0079500 [Pterospermum kingtungense]